MLKLIPCLLLTIFMTLLVRMLIEARERRQRLCQSHSLPSQITTSNNTGTSLSQNNFSGMKKSFSGLTNVLVPNPNDNLNGNNNGGLVTKATSFIQANQAERTTAMLTIIVAVFLITELPQGLFKFSNILNLITNLILINYLYEFRTKIYLKIFVI